MSRICFVSQVGDTKRTHRLSKINAVQTSVGIMNPMGKFAEDCSLAILDFDWVQQFN